MKSIIIIPFKSLTEGKSRLACVLDSPERARLCRFMLERTLKVAEGFGETVVVSNDPRVADVLASCGSSAHLLLGRPAGDLNLALYHARRLVARDARLVVLPADLVLLQRSELAAFMEHPEKLRIAPDTAGMGTNLLHLPVHAVPHFCFGFGLDSLLFHKLEARRIGYEPDLFLAPGSAKDIDTPADLADAGGRALFDYAVVPAF